jgi:hypothetical protein
MTTNTVSVWAHDPYFVVTIDVDGVDVNYGPFCSRMAAAWWRIAAIAGGDPGEPIVQEVARADHADITPWGAPVAGFDGNVVVWDCEASGEAEACATVLCA